jgi:hypothetical protein
VFNWQAHKPLDRDTISYVLQLQIYRKETDYTEIYHGESTSFRATNLESGVDYRARVCAIRTTNEGLTLNSPFSPATHFVLPRPEDLAAGLTATKNADHRQLSSDVNDAQISLLDRSRLAVARKIKSMKLFESRTLTDQQWAFVISIGFALLAIFIAIFANVVYSKYNNDASLSVDNTFSSPSSSPGIQP